MTNIKIYPHGIWAHINYDQLTQKEIEEFGIKLSEFPPMTLNHLRYRIEHIDDKYPRSMSPNMLLVILLISLLMGLVMVGYFLYRIYKMRSYLRSLKDLKIFFNGTANNEQLHELRTQLKFLLSTVDLHRLLPTGGPSPARYIPTTTQQLQEEQPPRPPPRPCTSHKVIPLRDLPSSRALEYAVDKFSDKGLYVKRYRAFLQRLMLSRTTTRVNFILS